ncbi:MAG: helix-hairpin-helix domain-containing protein, partial [Bryobacteraceae bacterium]
AHRFAVTFHRNRRDSKRLVSELDEAPGVGPKTVQLLLKEFGSVERVRAASEDELTAKVGRAAARRIRSFYATSERGQSDSDTARETVG